MVAINQMLIPIQQMTPGAVTALRSAVVNALVAKASQILNLAPEKLVVRNTRPVEDLIMYSTGTTNATVEDWIFTTAATTTTGFITITGDKTMADNRFVALYGFMDFRLGIATRATAGAAALIVEPSSHSLIRISVGGADRVIWDTKVVQAHLNDQVAVTNSPVIIPQNTTFNIAIYKSQATSAMIVSAGLLGVTVEPVGKIVSP